MIKGVERRRSWLCAFALFIAPAVFVSLLISSCGKIDLGDFVEEKDEGYTVTFNVEQYNLTDFAEQKVFSKSVKRERKAAKDLGSVLNFAVFSGDEKVASVNQKSSDPEFGNVAVKLPEGTYQVVVLIHSCSGNATISNPQKITFPNNKVTDTFAYYSDFEVTGNTDMSITVDRVVAKYHLTVEDAIPDEVKRMKFYYTGGSSTLDATTGFGCVNSRQTEYRDITARGEGCVFDVYTFPHDICGKLKMTVSALDNAGSTVEEHAFDDIPIEVKKVTNHTCPFFGGNSGGTSNVGKHISIEGDDAWTGELNY
jgi:hypothetical protein